jgi:hypothetical protein
MIERKALGLSLGFSGALVSCTVAMVGIWGWGSMDAFFQFS